MTINSSHFAWAAGLVVKDINLNICPFTAIKINM